MDNFDYKKYLVENKLTTNSRLNESFSPNEILEDTDWLIQLEDKLPTPLKDRIFIKRHEWHRVIKGTGTLTLKIAKT